MKQLLQNLKTGQTLISEIPAPHIKSGHFLIQTGTTLISAGTERMLVDFGRANYLQKARQQPEKVRQVLDKIRTDGLMPTINAVQSKLDQPLAIGYCNVGTVFETHGSQDVKVGDRVASNGPHAEIICVSRNLCAKIPANVSDEEAAFTVLGAIGLQGIRLAQPTIGESFVVTGLGLIGLLTVQILQANGCRVLGIDVDSYKCELAKQFGADTVDISKGEDPVDGAMAFSKGRGVDGVLITAATKSSEPVHQAAQMCRKQGRIVLVGVTGLELNRADFYEKELSFQVSCSYGPGRYDTEYEEKGHDYPIGFVRWTEQRNFEAVLELMASEKLNVKPLITHRFAFEKAEEAYEFISENKESYLGIVLNYKKLDDNESKYSRSIIIKDAQDIKVKADTPVIGLIGAGNFTGQVLLPALSKTNSRLKTIASSGGVTGTHLAKKFGFELSTSDTKSIFNDNEINTIFITTRHNTHASFVLKALNAGKSIFVEKPLCLINQELDEICNCYNKTQNLQIMVGFNRRFAPHIIKMKELLDSVKEPKSFIMTVNAGIIPPEHWTQDPQIGGGRIIGEACHFIDLLRFLAGNKIQKSNIIKLEQGVKDTVSISLVFEDGSIGTIHYLANGNKSFPKERLEVFCAGKILQMDNYKILKGYGWKKFKKLKLWNQDKGHKSEVISFINALKNGSISPIPFEEIVEVMKTTIQLAR
ncbi:Dehydrogenase [Candidatus Magnetomoraceae bacterium gMMP-15]